MEIKSILDLIESYENFPKKGITFRDVLPVLTKPKIFSQLIDNMSKNNMCLNSDAIIAIDARGFLFGSALALNLSKPLIVARKPDKLPGEVITNSYELEYGKNSLSINKDSIKDYESFMIVDDLLATGGTVDCVSNLLESQSKKVLGLNVVIELSSLNARSKLPFEVYSQICY